MTGFEADWLALREAADAVARDGTGLTGKAAAALQALGGGSEEFAITDLACGAGNNLRYLAGRLPGPQRWRLVDNDPDLLAAIARPRAVSATLETVDLDLAGDLDRLDLAGTDLVTASALFDLVSGDWIEAFAARMAAAEVPLGLFALTVDGRLAWTPEEPEDAEIAARFHEDMRRDKGFGPALGPEAPAALARAFEAAGYRVESADSAWRLDPADGPLQTALLTGFAEAAAARAPARAAVFDAWRERRADHIARGRSHLTVGHRDLLVIR